MDTRNNKCRRPLNCCPACDGRGEAFDEDEQVYITCSLCEGTGDCDPKKENAENINKTINQDKQCQEQ